MCGVFAYMGTNNALDRVLNGLKRLEYRGYDSWGVAYPFQQKIELFKSLEPMQDFDSISLDFTNNEFATNTALGHTRWATHGEVNISNCHPHVSSNGEFALVHNGIVENFQQLKQQLIQQGTKLMSETDSEVILRLIEQALAHRSAAQSSHSLEVTDYQAAFCRAFEKLNGHNTIVLICAAKNLLIGIRQGSPLIAGKNKNELFLASDFHSISNHSNQCLLIDDNHMITCLDQKASLIDLTTNRPIPATWRTLSTQQVDADKQQFAHFMLKEINEQWLSLLNACKIERDNLTSLIEDIRRANQIYITGAGAAFFVAEQIVFMLRQIAKLNAIAVPAYEAGSYLDQMNNKDLLLAISQSGETADTLRFIQKAKQQGVKIASLVNMPGAMMSRLSDHAFLSQSGAEICVLSTKTSSAQLTFGFLLAHAFINQFEWANQQVETVAQQLSHYFSADSLQDFAELSAQIKGNQLFLLGQGKYLSTAKIGALNIKEASYIHAEAFSAGELKHGVIALIEQGTPVICFVDDMNQDYMVSIACEVKARGGLMIGICQSSNPIFDHTIIAPAKDNLASIVSDIIPCQLLAYYLATQRGLNPDKPRNLAKSVTVI